MTIETDKNLRYLLSEKELNLYLLLEFNILRLHRKLSVLGFEYLEKENNLTNIPDKIEYYWNCVVGGSNPSGISPQ